MSSFDSLKEVSFNENKENMINNAYKTPSKKNASLEDRKSVTPEAENNPLRRSTRKITPSRRYNFDIELSKSSRVQKRPVLVESSTDSDSKTEDEGTQKSSQLFHDDVDVEGRRMFCFNTPKKRDGMALAAASASKITKTPKTPRTPRDRILDKCTTMTPDSKRKRRNDVVPKTPRHLRDRVKEELSKVLLDDSSSGLDFSSDDSDEFNPESQETDQTDSTSESEEDHPVTGKSQALKLPSVRRMSSRIRAREEKTEDYIPKSDGYFTSHASTKVITSDHTLDRLKNPRLPADQLFSLLSDMKLSNEHEKAISSMLKEHASHFSKWMYILNEGYNILLYGLGSKRELLQKFHREVLSEQTVVIVNGFFPSLTIKDVLSSVMIDILDLSSMPANPHECVNVIREQMILISQTHIFLIVHNIDGVMLRNTKAHEILSRLANIPNIHLLASIDHINTPLLWDNTKLSNYNFSWWDVTTMLPYSNETAFENSLLVQNSGELALASMRNVLQSLTTNARGIYMRIAKYQLEHKKSQNYQGMPFKGLYSTCREAFLVSSDMALRAQLTEFLDHKLVKSKRTIDGAEHLYIPIESALLQQFIEEQG